MDEPNQNELRWEPFVWRGALGGAIGMVAGGAVAIAFVLFHLGTDHISEGFLTMGVFGVVSGVLTGMAVGYIIYKVTKRWRTQPMIATRIAIGTICVLAYGLLTSLTGTRPFHMVFEIGYAVAVGGLAGLMARTKNPASKMS